MQQGWDPEVKKYFRKILATIGWGMLWIVTMLLFGFYLGLAFSAGKIATTIFYAFFAVSLGLLLRYYYRMWNKK